MPSRHIAAVVLFGLATQPSCSGRATRIGVGVGLAFTAGAGLGAVVKGKAEGWFFGPGIVVASLLGYGIGRFSDRKRETGGPPASSGQSREECIEERIRRLRAAASIMELDERAAAILKIPRCEPSDSAR